MPFCPRCRAEYRQGFDVCGTCDVPLVEHIEDIPEPMTEERVAQLMKGHGLVAVVRGSVEACKEVHRALLQEQIPAVVRTPEDAESFAAVAMILEVAVPEEAIERAVELLRADWHEMLSRDGLDFALGQTADEVGGEEEPACPACGCTKPLEDGLCPDCGLNLGDE